MILGGRESRIDLRALAAGIATVVIGAYATINIAFHFLPSLNDTPLLAQRWFWGFSFHLQFGCYFLVSLFHWGRVASADGRKKIWAIWQMLLALAFMSIPAISLAVVIANDWLTSAPSTRAVLTFCVLVPAFWIIGDVLVPSVRLVLRKRRGEPWQGRRRSFWAVSPLALLVLIALVDLPRGGTLFLIALPVLCYIQGSIGYFDRAFRPERSVKEQDGLTLEGFSSSN